MGTKRPPMSIRALTTFGRRQIFDQRCINMPRCCRGASGLRDPCSPLHLDFFFLDLCFFLSEESESLESESLESLPEPLPLLLLLLPLSLLLLSLPDPESEEEPEELDEEGDGDLVRFFFFFSRASFSSFSFSALLLGLRSVGISDASMKP